MKTKKTRELLAIGTICELLALVLLVLIGSSCDSDDLGCEADTTYGWSTIVSPGNGEIVTSLTAITGGMKTRGGVLHELVCRVRLYRDSDGKVWNGTSWVSITPAGDPYLTTSLTLTANDSSGKTWTWTTSPTPLPSGANLRAGYYGILVSPLVDAQNRGNSISYFEVGGTPPPVSTRAFGWGYNGNGEVGAGPGPSVNVPTPVKTSGQLDGQLVVAVAAGAEHSLALTRQGRVFTWGYNGFNQLGYGLPHMSSDEPREVSHQTNIQKPLYGKRVLVIGAGDYHSFAVTSEKKVYAWGRNTNGELGNGVTGGDTYNPVPVNMTGALNGKTVIGISGGDHHTVAVTDDGKIFAWGANGDGQLGTGNNTPSNVPVAVTGLDDKIIRSVDAGVFHTLALTSDGEVWAFGAGTEGLLGNGGTASSNVPVQVGTTGSMAGKKIIQISATRHHSLALSSDGKVYAWGSNVELGLGDGGVASFVTTPIEVSGGLIGKSVFTIGTGWQSSYAVTRDRKVFAWGNNYDGNLAGAGGFGAGVATPTEANTSGVLSITETVAGISGGWGHAVMLTVPRTGPEPDIAVEATTSTVPAAVETGGQLNFGTDAPGGKKVIKLSIRNRGNEALTDLSASLTGSDYTVDALPKTELVQNESMEFNITFTPSTTGTRTGTFHILSSDPDEHDFVINLTGTGVPLGNVDANVGALSLPGLVNATPVQTDGKIIFAGSFTSVGGTTRNNIARLNADGTLDTGFDPNVTGGIINCAAIQRDGKILIGGTFNSVGGQPRDRIARLESTGALDTTFNPGADASVNAIHVNADGSILVGGSFTNVTATSPDFLARLTAAGAVDGSFNPVLDSLVRSITVQNDGMILIGGNFSSVSGQPRTRLARIDPNGIIDTSFTANVSGGNVFGVQALPDGKILAAGEFDTINGSTRNRIARMSSAGVVDGYNPNVLGSIFSMALQADGSVIIGGTISSVAGNARSNVARIKADGTLDADFNPTITGGGPIVNVNGVTLQPDGKMVLAGNFNSVNGITRNCLVQISNINGTQTVTTGLNAVDEVIWSITGGAPQTIEPTLEKSTNGGANWTLIGQGVRLTAPATGWQWLITGSLPTGGGLIRLRASAPSGLNGGSSSVIEQVINYNGPPIMAVSSTPTGPLADFSSYNFGPLSTGKAKLLVLHVTNNGGTPLTGLVGANFFGDNAIEFWAASSTFPNTIAPGEGADLTFVYQPRNVGSHTATLQIPNNDPVHAAQGFQLFLSGLGGQPIGTWRMQNFGQSDNEGVSLDSADPDLDGRTNLAEFALGTDPNAADSSGIGSITSLAGFGPAGGTFFFNYTRSKLATADVAYQVEWSDSLTSNDWHTTDVSESLVVTNGDAQQVQATVPRGTASHRFVRLRLTRIY